MGPEYEPNIFIYDNYPGGIGFSEPLYRLHAKLLREGLKLIEDCPCLEGCPSCVGPSGEVGVKGKEVALSITFPLQPLPPFGTVSGYRS